MCALKLKLKLLCFVVLQHCARSIAIVTKPSLARNGSYHIHATRLRDYYLSEQRPLWVLEDQVRRPSGRTDRFSYTTTKPYHYHSSQRRKTEPTKMLSPKWTQRAAKGPHIQLPANYLTSKQNGQYRSQKPIPVRRQQWQRKADSRMSLPTFDSTPGDENAETWPIFIYNGPKGELIVNTMLSMRHYPMQEPVPGQILYPPSAPLFRPKPIVQRYRAPTSQQKQQLPQQQQQQQREYESFNLTLIPFYAHEAIDPPSLDYESRKLNIYEATAPTIVHSSIAPTPTVLYAAPAHSRLPTAVKITKRRRQKQAKQYEAYRSPHEVHWRPTSAPFSLSSTIGTTSMQQAYTPTTPFPLTLANPLQNHRYAPDELEAPTTATPRQNLELTSYHDGEHHIQIVYIDESMDKPHSTATTPTQTAKLVDMESYGLTKEYYAFPVYTLGKLLEPEELKQQVDVNANPIYTPQQQLEQKNAVEDSADTWFILNSRYKGPEPQWHNNKYRISSKYTSSNDAHRNSIFNF